MQRTFAAVLLACVLWLGTGLAGAVAGQQGAAPKDLRVVASIKPVHSLVAGVMAGTGEPVLLVKGGQSPHTYVLRPSEAKTLESAQEVFWVGPDLETFLRKPLAALAQRARIVRLHEAEGVRLLPYRSDGSWEAHHDDEGGGHNHGSRAHDHGRGHDHRPEKADDHGAGHEHGAMDMHIWLDADNAKAMVAAIVQTLSAADPARGEVYAGNGRTVQQRITAMDEDLARELAAVADRRYIVFHDAYQYLEKRYKLSPAGSITVGPERQPGAERLSQIRAKIIGEGVDCVFSEPQFEPALVKTVIAGTPARTGVLDGHGGVGVPAGADAYFTIMANLAGALKGCLTPAS